MAQAKNRIGKADSIISLLQWAWDRGAVIASAVLGGGVMSRLAATTEWIGQYGPIAWGGVGLLTFLIIMAALMGWTALSSRANLRNAQSQAALRAAERSGVNPLETRFYRQRIYLADMMPVDGAMITGKTFEECELIGPAVVVLWNGVDYGHNGHSFVDFIKIGPMITLLPNKLVLEDCTIRRCKVSRVVFLVQGDLVQQFEAAFGEGGIPWLN